MVKCPCCLTWHCHLSQFSPQHHNLWHVPRRPSLISFQLICLHGCASSMMGPFRVMVIVVHDFLSGIVKLNISFPHACPSSSCVHCDDVIVTFHVTWCALSYHEICFCSSACDGTLSGLFHDREISSVADVYPCCDFEICKITIISHDIMRN